MRRDQQGEGGPLKHLNNFADILVGGCMLTLSHCGMAINATEVASRSQPISECKQNPAISSLELSQPSLTVDTGIITVALL